MGERITVFWSPEELPIPPPKKKARRAKTTNGLS
jgi:hypothetical protein